MIGDMRMPLGRHRGQPLSSLPSDYLLWLGTLDNLHAPLRAALDHEMTMRRDEERTRRCGTGPVGAVLNPEVAAAAQRIVQARYRQTAREAHPDRGGATAEIQAVDEAAGVLRRWLNLVNPQGRRRSA